MNTPAIERAKLPVRPSRSYELFILEPGETLLAKAADARLRGFDVANSTEIIEWMRNDQGLQARGEIVIADPTVAPIVRGSEPYLMYQVPAHCSFGRGAIHENGLIDLFVPAGRRDFCGTLAILGKKL